MTRRSSFFFLAALSLVATLPVAVLALYAVAPGWAFPDVLPSEYGLRAVRDLLAQGSSIGLALASSLGFSLAVTAFSAMICLVPAKFLARSDFPGKSLVEGLALAPALVPAVAWSLGAHHVFIRLGLTDTFAGVVLILLVPACPYMLRALIAGYQSFGPEYEACARNLGASGFMVFRRVDLPMLVPALAAGASVVFLVSFSEYFLVFLIGWGVIASFTGLLFPYLTSSDRASASLLTLVFLAVPIALFAVLEGGLMSVRRRKGLY